MKYKCMNWKESLYQLVFIGMIGIFSSCDSYNFSAPQPVDKANIFEFPKELKGKWSAKEENDGGFYYFNKKYVLLVFNDTDKAVKGAWPKIDAAGKMISVPGSYNSIETITYDNFKKPVDTAINYLFRSGYVYEIADRKFLKKAYPFVLDKDTVVIVKTDTICIDLGQNAFLRQLNRNTYVLNIRNSILGEDASDYSNWWRLIILERKSDQAYNLWECTSKTENLPCRFFAGISKSNIFYFDCQWTSAEILQMMKEGYFEVSSEIIRD